jgi:type I restriction enzyme S subunit
LFNATNSPDLVGKTAFFGGCDEPVVYSNHFIRLRPKTEQLDPKYLARWLQREFERGYFKAKCKQWVNQATFGMDLLVRMEIPLSAVHDQRRIVAILDAADSLRVKRRLVLTQIRNLEQAIFVDMFGDQKAFTSRKLGYCVATTSGGTPSRSRRDYFEGDIPWVKSGELATGWVHATEESITEEALANSAAKLMPPGTVLLAMYGATVGAVATLGIEAATNQAICCVPQTNELTGRYLAGFLRTKKDELIRKAAGGAQPNISQAIIRDLDMPLPPFALQVEYSRRVDEIDVLARNNLSSQSLLNKLFVSLQQRAFRGDL